MFRKKSEPATPEQVMRALSTVQEPELHKDLVTLNMIKDLKVENGVASFTIVLTTPACPLRGVMEKDARTAVGAIPGVTGVNIKWDANVAANTRLASQLPMPARNVVAIASGKGGVGKTTVAVNVAVALAESGAKVGLLDADIYGPNTPMMLGVKYQPVQANGKIVPAEAYGIELFSMGFLVKDQQAIIHLAAYTNPAAAPAPELFRLNCAGTYNVFEAAAQEGIRRVVCASSINALGFNFGVKSFEIRYFPIDEEHPGFTTDAYSFSKQILEEIAAYYWRREGISSACLRLPFVVPQPSADMPFDIHQFIERVRRGYHKLLELPAAERAERVRRLVAHFDQLRAERAFEKPWDETRMVPPQDESPQPEDDTMEEMHLGYSDFWTVIHPDDSAQAFEKAVLADYQGSHALYVNSGQNWIGIPSETLAQTFYASVADRKRPVNGLESLVDIEKAHRLLGYEPEHPMGLE